MAETEKLIRSKAVGIRLDSKTHYLAKMAARHLAVNPGLDSEFSQATLSSFAEWAIKYVLRSDVMQQIETEFEATPSDKRIPTKPIPMWEESLWKLESPDRFFDVATVHHEWLTTDEKNLWRLFTMHMDFKKKKLTPKAFREFWNNPAIDTSHLKDWNQ